MCCSQSYDDDEDVIGSFWFGKDYEARQFTFNQSNQQKLDRNSNRLVPLWLDKIGLDC